MQHHEPSRERKVGRFEGTYVIGVLCVPLPQPAFHIGEPRIPVEPAWQRLTLEVYLSHLGQ